MCGLVGMMGNLYAADISMFNDMLIADYARGKHATGVAAIRTGGSVTTLKRAWNPIDLMTHKAYDGMVNSSAVCLIGHNRHGTIGDNSDHANAHPFHFENVVGAHNGTLERACVRDLHDAYRFGTDSEALYSEISQNGIDEAFTKIGGAWALSFYDKKLKTLNLIRNDRRPLYFAYKKGKSVLYWASEDDLIRWAAGRNGVELEDDAVHSLRTDILASWQCSMTFGQPTVRDLAASWVEPWKDASKKWDTKAMGWVPKGGDTGEPEIPFPAEAQSKGTETAQEGSQTKVIHLPGSSGKTSSTTTEQVGTSTSYQSLMHRFKDGKGQTVGYRRFREMLDNNCCFYCGDDDPDKIKFTSDVTILSSFNSKGVPDFLCEECSSDPLKRQIGKAM